MSSKERKATKTTTATATTTTTTKQKTSKQKKPYLLQRIRRKGVAIVLKFRTAIFY